MEAPSCPDGAPARAETRRPAAAPGDARRLPRTRRHGRPGPARSLGLRTRHRPPPPDQDRGTPGRGGGRGTPPAPLGAAAPSPRAVRPGRKRTARHSPVLPPPCPPTPQANRALRRSPPVPNHAAPARTGTRRTPTLRPDAAARPGSPTPRTSGAAGSSGLASRLGRRKSRHDLRPAPEVPFAASVPAATAEVPPPPCAPAGSPVS